MIDTYVFSTSVLGIIGTIIFLHTNNPLLLYITAILYILLITMTVIKSIRDRIEGR